MKKLKFAKPPRIDPKTCFEIINVSLRVSLCKKMTTIDFRNVGKLGLFRWFWKDDCFFRKFVCLQKQRTFFLKSLYEPSRQWLDWQFTGGPKYRLPGDQKLDFWEFFFNSFWFKLSRGRLVRYELWGSVFIDEIWILNEIEKLDRSTCKKSLFWKSEVFSIFFKKSFKACFDFTILHWASLHA